MAPSKRSRSSKATDPPPSPELGAGDWAFSKSTATGRAIRRCRNHAPDTESPFEDSAIAISDPEEDEFEEREMDDVICVAHSRKRRRRSVSPDLPLLSDSLDMPSDAESDRSVALREARHNTVHLTVNIPAGHHGPITLRLDPKGLHSPANEFARDTNLQLNARSKPKSKKRAGFLDLPAELRNEIYRMVFVTAKNINFAMPDNFSRSGQILRTCKQIHEEARSILYSENSFAVERRTQRYGSLWENEWRELGYLTVRKFFKSVGPDNTALIRKLSMMLEDAVPCLNPALLSNEDRRFVNDEDLISVLRHLGNYSQLQTFELHFHGRRRVERTDDRFLDYMKRIKSDEVRFTMWPPGPNGWRRSKQDDSVQTSLLGCCTRKKKRFD